MKILQNLLCGTSQVCKLQTPIIARETCKMSNISIKQYSSTVNFGKFNKMWVIMPPEGRTLPLPVAIHGSKCFQHATLSNTIPIFILLTGNSTVNGVYYTLAIK